MHIFFLGHPLVKNIHSKYILLFILLLSVHFFLRIYQLEDRTQFTYDQVDNAWTMKNILVDGKYPFVGPAVKQNSGFYLGPLYYYLLVPFYWFFNLDPIASAVFSVFTSVVNFIILFFVVKNIFSVQLAFVGNFLYTFSAFALSNDHVQWNVGFLPSISLLVFYSLYKIFNGQTKFTFLLFFILGISLNVHFTAIFFLL